ncbi:hypothetical protein K432DRAFT_378041 [Lepidopterella palustris CBS 459.81]|uniref:Uncharacterized protein n=1 Tax=Lepidopterella palustris CBS 459.81 TaxID=1314670 RepID=A0A8E2JJS2_9PEZI|nr:hypothetical protein K432DRAFT_378041 [Lepidopterella palustris CBS 459.81]
MTVAAEPTTMDNSSIAAKSTPAPSSTSATTPTIAKDVTSATNATEASSSTSAAEPEPDFEGNVSVSKSMPTQADLDKCADLLVLDSDGASRPFKSLYMGEGVAPRQLIIFVRHFFCGNCQEYLRTLSSSITPESLLTLPTPTFITVIGCGRPDLIEMYASTSNCPFPIYADPTRKLYDLLGMTNTLDLGKKPEYIQTSLFATTVQSIVQVLKTGRDGLKGGDIRQVGGEFMFEDGRVVWCHRMRNTRDHAEVTELRKILGLDDSKPPMRKRWSHGIRDLGKRSGSWKNKEGKEGKRSGSVPRAEVPEKLDERREEEEGGRGGGDE